MYKAIDIANELIRMGVNQNTPITHMQLHKLLYYFKGIYMAVLVKKPFQERFTKWPFGPVCVPVYYKFNHNSAMPIQEEIDKESCNIIDDDYAKAILKAIWQKYAKFSGIELSNMSHLEAPWRDANMFCVIPDEWIRQYFAGQLSGIQVKTVE